MRKQFSFFSAVRRLVLLAAVCVLPLAVQAQVIFNDSLQTSASSRDAGDSPVAHITVSANVTIASISVLNDIEVANNQKFIVYDGTSSTFLLVTAPKAFSADSSSSFTWKQSNPFAPITLVPGHDYYIGAISDQAGYWAFNTSGTYVQGAISSLMANGNVSSYAAPAFTGIAGARIPLQLVAGQAPVTAPVPALSEWSLLILGSVLAFSAGLYLRRRSH